METISNSVWQRKGSSIVFDQISLGPFIEKGAVISLRQLMSWAAGLPANPSVPGKTILVSGLETVVETMAYPDVTIFDVRHTASGQSFPVLGTRQSPEFQPVQRCAGHGGQPPPA